MEIVDFNIDKLEEYKKIIEDKKIVLKFNKGIMLGYFGILGWGICYHRGKINIVSKNWENLKNKILSNEVFL